MIYDPGFMLLSLVGMGLVFLPQVWVKNTVATYRDHMGRAGLNGAELARRLLTEAGIHNVVVEATPGELSDHYDPQAYAVRLSDDNYYGSHVAGLAIAAHEVGHAIQHSQGYAPVVIRSQLAPLAGLGSQLGPLLLMVSLGLGVASGAMPAFAMSITWLGIIIFGLAVAFHLVTLPVELDASRRAMLILADGGYLTDEELPGAKKVLTAAAMTYVATALYSLMQLLYWVFRVMNARQQH